MMQAKHIYFPSIDSTNNACRRMAGEAEEYTVISAGEQTAGRGRSGHDWVSPPGVSVATSMLLYPPLTPAQCSRLTLLAALSVADAVEALYPLSAKIKWPNDILINGKKLCGILTEMEAAEGQVQYVIIGIGVNVHHTGFPGELKDKATSLDLELSPAHAGRRAVTEEIWKHFLSYYEAFLTVGDLSSVKDAYEARLLNRGRTVRVMDPRGAYEATAEGIDETGALCVIRPDGERVRIDSGEVSVRGLQGYI